MGLCASCGAQLPGDDGLCSHHGSSFKDHWAVANRIMCDFLHRKRVPERLASAEQDDDFGAYGFGAYGGEVL